MQAESINNFGGVVTPSGGVKASKAEAEGRQEDEDCRYYTIPLTKKTRPFMLWVVGLFPWPVLEFIFLSRDILGTFSAILRVLLGLTRSNFFCRPLVPRFIKFLIKALPGD